MELETRSHSHASQAIVFDPMQVYISPACILTCLVNSIELFRNGKSAETNL